MRDESTIRAELESAKAEYQSKANSLPPAELRPYYAAVRTLQDELTAALSDGAVQCPQCGTAPHGMLRTPGHGRVAPIYEVGCLTCPASAHGPSSAEAVKAWNRLFA